MFLYYTHAYIYRITSTQNVEKWLPDKNKMHFVSLFQGL